MFPPSRISHTVRVTARIRVNVRIRVWFIFSGAKLYVTIGGVADPGLG